ncbi:hypothetical protein KP509_26G055500 [Ceratopteris richardii]|uniref:Uncharacterized protein n=1 Tax=Ceratopteris richardii TaxID=49495 RepID=A0A8T2RL38_CERRI|nr:hypothetical protein KP509_26G055500 [Ceratopteris richardii]
MEQTGIGPQTLDHSPTLLAEFTAYSSLAAAIFSYHCLAIQSHDYQPLATYVRRTRTSEQEEETTLRT